MHHFATAFAILTNTLILCDQNKDAHIFISLKCMLYRWRNLGYYLQLFNSGNKPAIADNRLIHRYEL